MTLARITFLALALALGQAAHRRVQARRVYVHPMPRTVQ